MKVVSYYIAEDGQTFEDKNDCQLHESYIHFKAWFTEHALTDNMDIPVDINRVWGWLQEYYPDIRKFI